MRPFIFSFATLIFVIIAAGAAPAAHAQPCAKVGDACTDGGSAGTCVSISGVGLFCNTASPIPAPDPSQAPTLAPAAHAAPLLSTTCTKDPDCPPTAPRCDMSSITSGNCTASLTPSGNGAGTLSPGGTYTQPGGRGDGPYTQPGGRGDGNVTLINPLNSGDCTPNGACLMDFLRKILDFVIQIGGIAIVLMLVYVGYLFVVAQGEPGKISEARNALLWTVIGALILLGSKAISVGIEATVKALSVGQ